MVINPIVGVYIPIIRIPSLKVGGLPSPKKNVTTWNPMAHMYSYPTLRLGLILFSEVGDDSDSGSMLRSCRGALYAEVLLIQPKSWAVTKICEDLAQLFELAVVF